MRISNFSPPTFESARWLVVAIALAIGLEATIISRAVSINVDGLMFIDVAKGLERDPLKTMRSQDQHPGYPAMIIAAERTLELFGCAPGPGAWTAATRLASGICGALSVIAMWLFARRMFGRQIANLAALSIAVLPLFRMNASDALSDTPHLLFYLLAAWCAAEAFSSGRAWWWAACGLASGAAFWVRPEGLETALVAGFLLSAMLLLRLAPRAQTVRSIAALGGAMALVVIPYVLLAGKITSKQLPFFKHESVPLFIVTESQEAARLAAQQKTPVVEATVADPSTDGSSTAETPERPASAEQPEADAMASAPTTQTLPPPPNIDNVRYFGLGPEFEAARKAAAEKALVDRQAAAAQPPAPQPEAKPSDATSSALNIRVALSVARRATVTFSKNMAWGFRFAFLPLYFLGNWEMIRRRVPWWTIALPAGMGVLHIGILYWVFFLSGYMDQRHVMVLVALALPFAALGMMYSAEVVNRFLGSRVSRQSALAAIVVVACVTVTPRAMVRMNTDLMPVLDTADWLHSQAQPGEAVISNTPFIMFYGQTPGVRLAPETATIEAAILGGPANLKYDYAVLDLKIEGYRTVWREQIERDFDEVMRLDDPRGKNREPKLLVYRRRTSEARSSTSDASAEGVAPQIGSAPGARLQ